MRYKQPDGDVSTKFEVPFAPPAQAGEPSADYDFAAAVAMTGLLLRNSEHRGQASWALAIELAQAGLADDRGGYRAEFLGLAKRAGELSNQD